MDYFNIMKYWKFFFYKRNSISMWFLFNFSWMIDHLYLGASKLAVNLKLSDFCSNIASSTSTLDKIPRDFLWNILLIIFWWSFNQQYKVILINDVVLYPLTTLKLELKNKSALLELSFNPSENYYINKELNWVYWRYLKVLLTSFSGKGKER